MPFLSRDIRHFIVVPCGAGLYQKQKHITAEIAVYFHEGTQEERLKPP